MYCKTQKLREFKKEAWLQLVKVKCQGVRLLIDDNYYNTAIAQRLIMSTPSSVLANNLNQPEGYML